MKFLFDQNISQRILKVLPEIYIGSSHVKIEGLLNSSDRYIWEFAKKNGFIIVTQDSDFNELNSLLGFPPKIIWIRTGNLKTQAIINILIDNHLEILKFVEDENFGCFELVRIKK
jgi:predicted nuclease of predicted toxin-antitoxin system